ncbi:MAG TPA: DUF1761 domain-containing protein [Cryptosporangiaceae bacterium]|nr:DUF1761 domain-containing protein [Cryptosporangiaceae bacterium]
MDAIAPLGDVNYWAVLVAAVVGFAIGGAWYSPMLFAKPWMRLSGSEPQAGESPVGPLAVAFVSALVAVFVLALFVGRDAGVGVGALAGLLAGLGLGGTGFAMNYAFEKRPLGLLAINAGYWTVMLTVAGAILGAW